MIPTTLGLTVAITGTVGLSEPAAILSSPTNPVWVTGTLGGGGGSPITGTLDVVALSGSVVGLLVGGQPASAGNPLPVSIPTSPQTIVGSYGATVRGTFTPSGVLSGTVAGIYNSSTGSLPIRIRRAAVSVTMTGLSNAADAGWTLGGRSISASSSLGVQVPSVPLASSYPAAAGIVYSKPSDLPLLSPMDGAAFPMSYPNAGLLPSPTTSLGGEPFQTELIVRDDGFDEVVLAPGETFVVTIGVQDVYPMGAPEFTFAAAFRWVEG